MHFANSGEDALGKLAGGVEPTLIAILSEINMPGVDGLQLLGEIKQRFPDLVVMMVTAYGDNERRRCADQLGAAEFFTRKGDHLPNTAWKLGVGQGKISRCEFTICMKMLMENRIFATSRSNGHRSRPMVKCPNACRQPASWYAR